MRSARRSIIAALLAVGIATGPALAIETNVIPGARPIVPDVVFKLSPSTTIALEKIIHWGIYAGVAYLVLDPLAPNWQIEAAPLSGNHVHLSMKMKRFYDGGAGEARAVFHRRAKEIMRLNDFDAYKVLEYSEGLESSMLGSQRTAEGVVVLSNNAPRH